MKIFKIVLLLFSFSLFFMFCSKDKDEAFNPDLTKNAIYLNDDVFTLTQGIVTRSWNVYPYEFTIALCSSGISIDTTGTNGDVSKSYSGKGDALILELHSETQDGIKPGTYTYVSDDEDDGLTACMELEFMRDINISTFEISHDYGLKSGTMTIQKTEDVYEITINGKGCEYDDDIILQDGINIAVHYKGSIIEYNFP